MSPPRHFGKWIAQITVRQQLRAAVVNGSRSAAARRVAREAAGPSAPHDLHAKRQVSLDPQGRSL